MAVRTKRDWSNTTSVFMAAGTSTRCDAVFRTPSTTAMVFESPPCFMTGRYTERWPFTRTTLYCSACASFNSPTSDISTGFPPFILMGYWPASFKLNWALE